MTPSHFDADDVHPGVHDGVPAASRRYLRHGMLPQLAAFEAVMRLGSVARAAEALCVAQPTLSGHLRKLSEALGVPLFALQGKRLLPTPAARCLLQTAREVFAAMARCEESLARLRPLPAASRDAWPAGAGDAAWLSALMNAPASAHAAPPRTPRAAAPAP